MVSGGKTSKRWAAKRSVGIKLRAQLNVRMYALRHFSATVLLIILSEICVDPRLNEEYLEYVDERREIGDIEQ